MVLSKKEKSDVVEEIKSDLKKFPTIAIASNAGLPSRQYNLVKKKTREHAKIGFARQTFLARAIGEGKPEAKELEKHFCNGAVLVFSDLNAFKLFRLFKKNKSKTFAKPGAIAPSDIIVPAGETNLAPGPVLTELKQAKIDAKIQGPKVVIAKDAVVAKKGEPISEPVAKILAKLGIAPFEIGLEIKAVYDNGTLYTAEILDVDEAAMFANLITGVRNSLNLAVFAEIYNAHTTPLILVKAAREANALHKTIKEKIKPAEQTAIEQPAEAEKKD